MASQPFSLEDLGNLETNLPTEYSRAVLENLDRLMAQQEEGLTRDVLNRQENLGILKSGETGRQISEDVLGPGIERRRGSLLGLVGQGLEGKRQERASETQFQRERQLRAEAFQNRLRELRESLSNQKELLRLQMDLDGGGGGGGDDWAGTGLGILGSFVGSMGGPIGGMIGGALGKKVGGLFGSKKKGRSYDLPGYGADEDAGYDDLLEDRWDYRSGE